MIKRRASYRNLSLTARHGDAASEINTATNAKYPQESRAISVGLRSARKSDAFGFDLSPEPACTKVFRFALYALFFQVFQLL